MKLLSPQTVIPATAIALGATVLMGEPGAAADDYYVYPINDSTSYSDSVVDYPYLSNRSWVSYQDYPGYHYAYYQVARPEYIL